MTHQPAHLRALGLAKVFLPVQPGSPSLELFRDLQLEVHRGETVAIVGESGAGKSSLLQMFAALDRPSAGRIWVGDCEVTALGPTAAARLRNRDVGYVWQAHYLLPEFSAEENVALPLLARGLPRHQTLESARAWLFLVGLLTRAEHRAGELSGGEQQRVAIARALITGPSVLLADEPTGNLDAGSAEHIFSLLLQLTAEHRLATLLVTHSPAFAARCDRTLRLNRGQLLPVSGQDRIFQDPSKVPFTA